MSSKRAADDARGDGPEAFARRVGEQLAALGVGPGARPLLVGFSGGPDSLALLAAIAEAVPTLRVHAAHVDHRLREGSSRDAEQARALAAAHAEAFHLLTPTVEGPSANAARRARLAALEELASTIGAADIALGHTASDQLETLLMRLVRGAGVAGLAGIPPRRGPFVRPLLGESRASVLAYLSARGLAPLVDPSNASARYLRNRVRRDVVPVLQAENPRVIQTASATAQLLREAEEALAYATDEAWARVTRPFSPYPVRLPARHVALHAGALGGLPRGLASRVIRRGWRDVAGLGAELGAAHVGEVLALAARRSGSASVDLPGAVRAVQAYDLLHLLPREATRDPGDWASRVDGAGVASLAPFGLRLSIGAPRPQSGDRDGWSLQVDGKSLVFPLDVRNPRPGDRVRGGSGRRHVSDLLIDRKVPRFLRRRLPVVWSGGQILWIPGVWHGPEARRGAATGWTELAIAFARGLDPPPGGAEQKTETLG